MESRQVFVGKLSGKGNVTIPKPMREYLRLEQGDHIIFRCSDIGDVTIEKASISSEKDNKN